MDANETKTQATKGATTIFQNKLSVVQLKVRVKHFFATRLCLTWIDLSSALEVALNFRQNESKLVVTIIVKQKTGKTNNKHKETIN